MRTLFLNRSTFLFNAPCASNEDRDKSFSHERVVLMDSVVRAVLEKLPEKVIDNLKDVKFLFDKDYNETLVIFFFAGYFITRRGREGWEAEIEGKFCFNINPNLTRERMCACLLGLIYSEITECSSSRPARPILVQQQLIQLAGGSGWG